MDSPRESPILRSEERLIEDLTLPISRIVSQLQPEIEQGAYDLILGDLIGGLYPARIVGEVFTALYKERGFVPPILGDFAGHKFSRFDKRKAIEERGNQMSEWIRDLKAKAGNKKNKKILIVTDLVHFGRTLQPVVYACKVLGYEVDVASVMTMEGTRVAQEDVGTRVVSGGRGLPKIYTEGKHLTGLRKQPGALFAEVDPVISKEKVREAENVAHVVAQSVLGRYRIATDPRINKNLLGQI